MRVIEGNILKGTIDKCLYMRPRAFIPTTKRKEVIEMLILHGGILALAVMNLAVNAALGVMILLHCPHVTWPFPIKRPDWLQRKLDLKSEEKGETKHEQSVD